MFEYMERREIIIKKSVCITGNNKRIKILFDIYLNKHKLLYKVDEVSLKMKILHWKKHNI